MGELHTIANDLLLGEVCALLARGKQVKLRAKGRSMRPFICGGKDILVIAPAEDIRRGDIVLAHTAASGYVVHRVVSISGERILLAGDGNLFQHEACDRADVAGIVTAVIRNGRRRSMTSAGSRLMASGWRRLLPVRRAWYKLRKVIREV